MPTLEVSIEEGKLIAGLLNAERAQNKVDAAVKRTIATSKAWDEENKRAAEAEKRRHVEAVRMRQADDAAQKRSHDERQKMYQELFANQDKQRRNIQQIISSERAYAAALRETATAAQRAFAEGRGGLSGQAVRDPWGAGMMRMGPQLGPMNAQAAARAKAQAAFAASQAAAQAQVSGFGLNNPLMPPHLRGAGGNPMAPFSMAKYMAATATGKTPPVSPAFAAQQAIANQVQAASAAAGGALNNLGSQLMGFVSVTSIASKIIATATQALDMAQQQRASGGESLKSDFDVYREISEVSEPGQAKGRIARYEKLRGMGLDRETAWGLLEKGIATGNEGSVERFARTQGAMNPALAMSVGSHLETLYNGQVNEVEAANMVLEASRKSRYTVGQFAPSVATAAVGGTLGGSSTAEMLAMQSVMSDVLGSPEQASDRIQYAGVRGSQSPDLKSKGKGVLAMMMEMHEMPFEGRHRTEFAGNRIEYNSFIDKVAENKDKILQRQREIEAAQARAMGRDSNLEVAQREFMSTPEGREMMANRIAAQQEEGTVRDAYGTGQLQTETTRRRIRQRAVKRGEGPLARGLEDRGAGIGEWVGGTPGAATAGGLAGNIAGGGSWNPVNMILQMVGLQTKTNELLVNIERNTGKEPAKQSPATNGGGRR